MKRVLTFVVLLLVSCSAFGDHFGLNQGDTLGKIKKLTTLEKVSTYFYKTSSLPNGNSAFSDYRLVITPEHGLCKIIAWTPEINTSVYGDGVKDEFDRLYAAVSSKYGKGKKVDYLRTGSIWNGPQDWMMGLLKEERILDAFWTKDQHVSLPPTLHAMMLKAVGLTQNQAMIELEYEFNNFPACSAEIKAIQNSSL